MSTKTSGTDQGIDRRLRRACEENMMVVNAGGGEFEVYSGETSVYEVNLATGTFSCPDARHHAPTGGCKHLRRVELEAGLEDVPNLRSEHAAPTDVELGRRARGIDLSQAEPEPEPEPITVETSKPDRQVAMTDGGTAVLEDETRGVSAEDGCPRGHPDCEGPETPGYPELCWDCWEVWC